MGDEALIETDSALRSIARRDPGRIALDLAGRAVTFARVDEAADRLAQALLDHSSHEELSEDGLPARVGVLINDTEAVLVAAEAIRRAGMVAVPIDPNTPPARQTRLIDSVGISLVLSDVDQPLAKNVKRLHPFRDGVAPPVGGVQRPPGRIGSILFTSGSTGPPKAVMKSPSRTPMPALQDREDAMRVGLVAAGSVAVSLAAIELIAGSGWTAVPYQIRDETRSMASWLRESSLEALILVPTVARQVIASLEPGEKLRGVKFVGSYGETVTWDDVIALRSHLEADALIFNSYGQTETGTVALMAIGPDTPIGTGTSPIGSPVTGCEITVVDENDNPVPDGHKGEIVVRSAQASLGYWGEDPARSTVFFPQPDGTMVVRTGDLGRVLPDGTLEHLGRADNMVKVAGANRVDLGEVELALMSLDGVAAAAVAPFRTPRGETRLRAFVVPSKLPGPDPGRLRAMLADQLPRYALPDAVELIDQLPRLGSGKVDRRALPVPGSYTGLAPGAESSTDDHLHQLSAIWREVLFVDSVGEDDDFFDLGGDSLRAVWLVGSIHRMMGIDLPLVSVIENPTLRAMASELAPGSRTSERLVTMQTGGPGRPVFAVHDFRGNLFQARQMLVSETRLEQPIYGLRSLIFDEGRVNETTLESLAAAYVQDIRDKVGDTAAVIFGLDTGCILAFEVARQLAASGSPEPLLLLATGGPPPPHNQGLVEPVGSPRRPLYRRVGHRLKWAIGFNRRKRAPAMEQIIQLIPEAAVFDDAERTYTPLWRAYRMPGPFDGRLLLFHGPAIERKRVLPWATWVEGTTSFFSIPELLESLEQAPARSIESLAFGSESSSPGS